MWKKRLGAVLILMLLCLVGCDNNKGPFVKRRENGNIVLYANDRPVKGWVANYLKDDEGIEVKVSDIKFENGIPMGEFNFYDEDGIKYLSAKTVYQRNLYFGDIKVRYSDGKEAKLHGEFDIAPNWILEGQSEFIIEDYRSPQELAEWIFNEHCVNGGIDSPYLKGSYKDGKKDGEWEFYNMDGTLLTKGTYKENVKDGLWSETVAGANLIKKLDLRTTEHYAFKNIENPVFEVEGTYKDGTPDGPWTYFDENHNLVMEGHYVDGKIQGQWKFYNENGEPAVIGTYENEVKNGPWEFLNDSGEVVAKGNYLDGERNGPWQEKMTEERLRIVSNGIYTFITNLSGLEINPDPKEVAAFEAKNKILIENSKSNYLVCTGNYEKGIIQGPWRCQSAKNELLLVSFKDGKLDGPWQCYSERNVLLLDGGFKNGKLDGTWKLFYDNGVLGIVSNYKDGNLDGIWKLFYQNGYLVFEGQYKDNEPTGIWKYYENDNKPAATAEFKDGEGKVTGNFFKYLNNLIKILR